MEGKGGKREGGMTGRKGKDGGDKWEGEEWGKGGERKGRGREGCKGKVGGR